MKNLLNKEAIKYYLKNSIKFNKRSFIFFCIFSFVRILAVPSLINNDRQEALIEEKKVIIEKETLKQIKQAFLYVKEGDSRYLSDLDKIQNVDDSNVSQINLENRLSGNRETKNKISNLNIYKKFSNLFFSNFYGIDYQLKIENFVNNSIEKNRLFFSRHFKENNYWLLIFINLLIFVSLSTISCNFFSRFIRIILVEEFFDKLYENLLEWSSSKVNNDKFVILNTSWTRREIFISKFIVIFLISSLVSLSNSLFVFFYRERFGISLSQILLYLFLNTFIFNFIFSVHRRVLNYLLISKKWILVILENFLLFYNYTIPFFLSLFQNNLGRFSIFKGINFVSESNNYNFLLIFSSIYFLLEFAALINYYNRYKKFDFKA
ncbi:MAG: hypothetical protein AD073_000186 [Mycoplasmataceae bacterium]|nr:MAG: hypothetical protein AD073_000186 [Mycoplasmataceae bacterium]